MNTAPDTSGFRVWRLRRSICVAPLVALLSVGAGLPVGCGDNADTATRPAGAEPASTPTGLPAEPPVLADIGAGLKGPKGLATTVISRGVTNVSDFAFDPSGRLFVTRASEGAHRGDGVYLLVGGKDPRAVVTRLAAPLGPTFIGDDLYVASEERLDRYSDFTGSGFRRHKTILSGLPAGKLAVVSEWALGKLIAIALKPRGSSFSATPSVLITGLENPGPVAATSNGALLVGEYRSGTIFRIAPGTPEPGETQTPAPSSATPAAATLTIAADRSGALKFAHAALTAKAGATTIASSRGRTRSTARFPATRKPA